MLKTVSEINPNLGIYNGHPRESIFWHCGILEPVHRVYLLPMGVLGHMLGEDRTSGRPVQPMLPELVDRPICIDAFYFTCICNEDPGFQVRYGVRFV